MNATEYRHTIERQGEKATLTWVGHIIAAPARVYALAFLSPHEMLLVSGGPSDPDRWLPGGGVEHGETPEQALRRELLEEADASIEAMESLGSQRMEGAQGRHEYHRFYWCRVTLAPQDFPRAESTLRHIVPAADWLDTLLWGRADPKAAMLLRQALEAERRYAT